MQKIKRFEGLVSKEVEKIRNTKKDFEERYVEGDIEEFVNAANEMLKLYKGEINEVKYKFNMWEVAHDSLDKIIQHFELKEVTVNEKDCYVKYVK